jgi:hypothetical protein
MRVPDPPKRWGPPRFDRARAMRLIDDDVAALDVEQRTRRMSQEELA